MLLFCKISVLVRTLLGDFLHMIFCLVSYFSDYNSLNEADVCRNNQLAFDKAQDEFGISPVMTGEDMANCEKPDKLTIVSYLSQFHDIFKKQRPSSGRFGFLI